MSTPATEGGNTRQGLSLDEAFAQLQANRNSAPEEDTLENEEASVEEPEEGYAEEEVEEEADPNLDEEEGEVDPEADPEASEEEPEVWELDIDGETVEVTTEELHKGYLRQQDYTRKRQAEGKRAKELEAEYQGKLDQLSQALAANVSAEEQRLSQLQVQYQKATDETQKRNIHYQMLQLNQSVTARQQALGQAQALQEQTMAAQQEAYWNEQEAQLQATYPDWEEKKVVLKDYLTGQGFEDLSMFAHASMAELVDKARQFDELQQQRKTVVTKKIRRKVPQVVKPGKGEKQFSLDQKAIQDAQARFDRTGKISDAQALLRLKRGK